MRIPWHPRHIDVDQEAVRPSSYGYASLRTMSDEELAAASERENNPVRFGFALPELPSPSEGDRQ